MASKSQQHVTVTNLDGSIAFDGDWLESDEEALIAGGIDVAACSVQEKLTLIRQQAFLAAYATCGTITGAAEAAGINRLTAQRWNNGDVFGFRERMEKAHRAFGDHLEDIALSRINDPTGNRGSDILLLALLNANRPDKYRQNVIVSDDTAKDVLKALVDKRTKRTTEVDSYTDETRPTPISAMRAKAKAKAKGG